MASWNWASLALSRAAIQAIYFGKLVVIWNLVLAINTAKENFLWRVIALHVAALCHYDAVSSRADDS